MKHRKTPYATSKISVCNINKKKMFQVDLFATLAHNNLNILKYLLQHQIGTRRSAHRLAGHVAHQVPVAQLELALQFVDGAI
jgi:hypothetical protein